MVTKTLGCPCIQEDKTYLCDFCRDHKLRHKLEVAEILPPRAEPMKGLPTEWLFEEETGWLISPNGDQVAKFKPDWNDLGYHLAYQLTQEFVELYR